MFGAESGDESYENGSRNQSELPKFGGKRMNFDREICVLKTINMGFLSSLRALSRSINFHCHPLIPMVSKPKLNGSDIEAMFYLPVIVI